MPRYTIDIGEKFDELLTELAKSQEMTKAEIIRRAVATYAFLSKQVEGGKKISVTDEKDHVLKDVVLP